MSKIGDLFTYPIQRDITTVIKMDDLRPQEIQQELEEYVVTDEIEDHLITFLERYAETRTEETDRIGVWISGFFGSGKSHFAKLLGYLLENRRVGSQSAIDLFRTRIVGSGRQGEIERLLHQAVSFIHTETIAFQIKTEEELLVGDGVGDRESLLANHISTIMYRQWLRYRGFSTTLWVGRLEQELTALGCYEAFVAKVGEQEGEPWEEVRQHDMLVRDAATAAMTAILPDRYPSVASASKAIDDIQMGLRMGPGILARELAEWTDRSAPHDPEKTPHLVYIIDEVGQFVGDSNEKLLEIQSIAEAFATNGRGRLWLVVTAQEVLEEIVRDAIRREREFDKIRARFDLRLSLTSQNIETVVEERILRKKESKRPELEALYRRASGNIGAVCTLEGASRPIPQPEEERFVADYPFPPYQLAILQQIFSAVRTPHGDRERIEGTERSLIGVTQAILKSSATGFADSKVGRLVAFDEIYDQIQAELPGIDRREIDGVALGTDPDFLRRILKALYLIQKLEWVPRTVGNLAHLLSSHVDDPKMPFAALKQRIEEGLLELQQGHYVVESGGQYEFLSGVKKDIEMEIASVDVHVNDRRREIKRYLGTILDFGRLNIVVRADDEVLHERGDITLQVYSPIYVAATDLRRDEVVRNSIGDERCVYWMTQPIGDLYREVGKLIQTDAVVTRRQSRRDTSSEESALLREKQRDMELSQAKIESLLRQSLLKGAIIYDGSAAELDGSTNQLSTVFAREVSRVVPHVYTRLEPALFRVDERSIELILDIEDARLADVEPDLDLFDDASRLNRHTPVIAEVLEELRLRTRSGDPTEGSSLEALFGGVPYGWDPILVRVTLAALFRAGLLTLKHEGREYRDYKNSRAKELLVGARDSRRTQFIYAPQVALSPGERREAQEVILRVFGRHEPDAAHIMSTALGQELDHMRRQNSEQRILAQHNDLPVKPILSAGESLIEDLITQEQPDARLKALLQQTSRLKELHTYQGALHEFVDAGRLDEYRAARGLTQAVERARRVVSDLDCAQVSGWLEEMQAVQDRKEIVERWAAFYRSMRSLLERYQAIYERLHVERRDTYAQVVEKLQGLDMPNVDLGDRMCDSPMGWTLDGLVCSSCGTPLETLYYQTQSAPQEETRLIAAHAAAMKSEPGTPGFVLVRLDEAIRTKDIDSTGDLEAAVQELREAVQDGLEADGRVLLQ